MFISSQSTKLDIKSGIIKILESHNYYVIIDSTGKLNRMTKGKLNELYNLIRYNWTDSTREEIQLIYGIQIKEE